MASRNTSHSTHKTPELMKLLTGSPAASNPILDEDFKAEIIRARENPEPVRPQPDNNGGTEINITSELVSQWLPRVMKRFNVCCCGRCSAEATVEAFDRIKPVIVKVRSDADLKRARNIKADRQQEVLMQLIKLVTARRGMPIHEKK